MAGQVLCTVLENATTALTAEAGDQQAEAATLLCRNAGMLLFRAIPAGDPDSTHAAGAATATVRRRLLAAAADHWSEVIQDCLVEIEDEKTRPKPVSNTPAFPHPGAALDEATLDRAAAKARVGGLRSAANILTGGPAVPPGPETDRKIHALFKMAADQTSDERSRFDDALHMTGQLPPKVRSTIRPRVASRIASHLRGSAGPGPSGFRNSFIQLVNDQPQGPRVLAAWATPWAQGTVQPWAAASWSHQICRPFFKGDSVGVRPVMCGEALFKYAAACAIFAATRSIQAAVGDFQYGAVRSGGAALQLAEVHAETRAHPDDVIASLDVKNAFGSITWADALRVTTAVAPKLAPFLGAIWGPGHQTIWTQATSNGGWTSAAIAGSLVQGGPEAHNVFCLVMAEIIRETQRHAALVDHPPPRTSQPAPIGAPPSAHPTAVPTGAHPTGVHTGALATAPTGTNAPLLVTSPPPPPP